MIRTRTPAGRGDWQAVIGRAASMITQRRNDGVASGVDGKADLDGLLFFGNPHETVPRALLLDPRLGHVDKLGWQMIRLLVNPDRTTAFPTYDELQPLLRAGPDQSASRKTVARVIAVLRLTRWLSLGYRARNKSNGRVIGNVYILHDEPLAIGEAEVFDTDYLEFVHRCLSHHNKTVRAVAQLVVEEIQQSGALHTQPARLSIMAERAKQHAQGHDAQFPRETQGGNPSFPRKPRQFPGNDSLSFHRKLSQKSKACTLVSSGNSDSTVRSYIHTCSKNPTTAPARGGDDPELFWPPVLELGPVERQAATWRLAEVPVNRRQAVLDEAAGRVEAGVGRSPKGLLNSLIERALTGEFNATDHARRQAARRGEAREPLASSPPAASPAIKPARPIPPRTPVANTPRVTPEEAAAARQACLREAGLRR